MQKIKKREISVVMPNIKLNLSVNKNLIIQWAKKNGFFEVSKANRMNTVVEIENSIEDLSDSVYDRNNKVVAKCIGELFANSAVLCEELGISFEECVKDTYYLLKDRNQEDKQLD